MVMMMRILVIASLAGALSFLAACNEPDQGRTGTRPLTVTMSSADRFAVAGRQTNRKGLEKALKSAGAGAATPVMISVPNDISRDEMAVLAKELSRAGFRRIAFTRPKKVVTTTEPL